MKITTDQQSLFWKLWTKACRNQGWTRQQGLSAAAIDAKRKEMLARCGFRSLKDVDPQGGFSLVKRELLKFDDQLQGAKEEIDPHIETGRTSRWFIEHDLIPCLALYVDDAWAYVSKIATDKFRWRTRDGMQRQITLDDLDDNPVVREVRGKLQEFPSQLEQLKFTLSGRLNGKDGFRKQAGDSIHDMRTKAGLPCRCARCCRSATIPAEAVAAAGITDHEPDPF
jgi:hypothetical protein